MVLLLVEAATTGSRCRTTSKRVLTRLSSVSHLSSPIKNIQHLTSNPFLFPGHPRREAWLEMGRQYKQRWFGEDAPPDDEEGFPPKGTCRVQAVRSVSDWSHGVLTEHSIQNACECFFRAGVWREGLMGEDDGVGGR